MAKPNRIFPGWKTGQRKGQKMPGEKTAGPPKPKATSLIAKKK